MRETTPTDPKGEEYPVKIFGGEKIGWKKLGT
jgi:hypothetical protein